MVRYTVIVRTRAEPGVSFDQETQTYHVSVRSPPEGGRANRELLLLLQEATGRQARLVAGFRSRRKAVELD